MKEKKVASFLFKTSQIIFKSLAIIGFMVGAGEVGMSQTNASIGVSNILLVHGGFVDGSGWERVYKVLKNDGYTVTIVQNHTISLVDDVAVTKRDIAAQKG